MLFPKPGLVFNPAWAPERAVRLGEAMADYPVDRPADHPAA
jgi:phosphatidylserine decarboxylase